jgi:hypothetical protein
MSSGLITLDYFLWVNMKDKVYQQKLQARKKITQ